MRIRRKCSVGSHGRYAFPLCPRVQREGGRGWWAVTGPTWQDLVKEIILLTCVRWYIASPMSNRPVEALKQGRCVAVDHATVNRWLLVV